MVRDPSFRNLGGILNEPQCNQLKGESGECTYPNEAQCTAPGMLIQKVDVTLARIN